MSNRFENLNVWRVSHELVLKIYKVTKGFPQDEKFRLGDQLRRASSSIPTNIVEGNTRAHKKEYIQFLYLAKGSLEETKYHLLLAKDLGYLKEGLYEELNNKCSDIGKMISGLMASLPSSAWGFYDRTRMTFSHPLHSRRQSVGVSRIQK